MLNKVRDADKKIHEIIEVSFPDLIRDVLKSHLKQTGRALTMLSVKSDFIKNGIFDACENDNLYSAKILYRSLIEHSLRHQYIFMKWTEDKNDSIGEDYYKYCDMGEDMDFIKSIQKISKLFDPEKLEENIWDSYCKLKGVQENISQAELEKKVSQFRYKSIIKYIWNKINDGLVKNFLSKILLEYSELSSYIHGGPFAEKDGIANVKIKKRNKSIQDLAEMAFAITKGIKLHTYLFTYQVNKKYGTYYNRIKGVKL